MNKSILEVIKLMIRPTDSARGIEFTIYSDGSYIAYDFIGHQRALCKAGVSAEERLLRAMFAPDDSVEEKSRQPFLYRGEIPDLQVVVHCALLRLQRKKLIETSKSLEGEVVSFLNYIFWREINDSLDEPFVFSTYTNFPTPNPALERTPTAGSAGSAGDAHTPQ